MRLSSPFVALATLAATASLIHAQGSPTDVARVTGPFVDALKKANLTILSGLVTTHAQALVPYMTAHHDKTLLTPTDEAINKVKDRLAKLSSAQIESILMYHVINGTISYKTLPSVFDYHVVAPTYLNNGNFSHLQDGEKQVVVLQRSDSKDPIDISTGANDTAFSSRVDGPTFGNIQIQVIDDVLFPPANFSTLVQEESTDLMAMHMALNRSQLVSGVEAIKGVTIFAPTTSAFQKVQSQAAKATDREAMMTMLNHIVNGTVVYSPQFPNNDAQNGPATTKITSLRTAAGMTLSFKYVKDGSIEVSSGNFTAKIVKSDVLISNGVVHYLDAVLLNTQYNQTSGANTTDQTTSPLPAVQTQSALAFSSSSSGKSSSSDGASILLEPKTFIVMSFTLVVATLFTLV